MLDASALRVVADDLTGACDIGAALLPWPGGIVVEAYGDGGPPPEAGLLVRNTQSRVLPEAEARRAVCRALGDLPASGLVLKKIDTALRGWLGAELEAALEAARAEEAFVMPAIPAVGRTTVDGIQRHDGVPVHETVFAEDPWHPVRDSDVAAAIERASGLRAGAIRLAEVRAPQRLATAVEAARARGARALVCDAELDADLDAVLAVVERRARPALVAGSIALGQAVRRRLPAAPAAPARRARGRTGALVVVGSAHPAAHAQARAVADTTPAAVLLAMAGASEDARVARESAARVRAGGTAVVCVPTAAQPGARARLLERTAAIAAACAAEAPPAALVLTGGETAHAVLRALAQPFVRIERALAPLVVGGALVGGRLDGTALVTKAGSAGAPEALVTALCWATGGAA